MNPVGPDAADAAGPAASPAAAGRAGGRAAPGRAPGPPGRAQVLREWFRDALLNGLAAHMAPPRTVRYLLYRAGGVRTETRNIRAGCFVGGVGLEIGKRCFINYGCFFDTTAPVELGADCYVGMQATFCTSTHPLAGPTRRATRLCGRPLPVGDSGWIAARGTSLPP